MPAHGEAYELRSNGSKDAQVSVNRNLSPNTDANLTSKQKESQRINEVLTSTTRIRRLFSEAQLFAFALTFMSTWVGMNT